MKPRSEMMSGLKKTKEEFERELETWKKVVLGMEVTHIGKLNREKNIILDQVLKNTIFAN